MKKKLYIPLFFAFHSFCIVSMPHTHILIDRIEPNDQLKLGVMFKDPCKINKALAAGADVNYQDQRGKTPLHYALLQRDASGAAVTQALIFAGANINIADKQGYTPLIFAMHYACKDTGSRVYAPLLSALIASNRLANQLHTISPDHFQSVESIKQIERILKKEIVSIEKQEHDLGQSCISSAWNSCSLYNLKKQKDLTHEYVQALEKARLSMDHKKQVV